MSDATELTNVLDRKVVQSLFHTLMQTYGNEQVYHPDGTTFSVAELYESYMWDKPAGLALELEQLESTLDTVASEILMHIDVPPEGPHYSKFREMIQAGIQAKFPCTKFSNF